MPYETEVGMDLHKMYSLFCVVKSDGSVQSIGRFSGSWGFALKRAGKKRIWADISL